MAFIEPPVIAQAIPTFIIALYVFFIAMGPNKLEIKVVERKIVEHALCRDNRRHAETGKEVERPA
jgi:hypothetical protein